MYSIDSRIKDKIYSSNPWVAKFGDIEGTIFSFRRRQESVSGGAFSLGGMISSTVEIEMEEDQSINVNRVERQLSIGMYVDDEVVWLPLGLYTPTKPNIQNGRMSFIAYDRVYSKMNDAYISSLTYPTDVKNVLSEIGTILGITIDHSNLESGITVNRTVASEDTTYDDDGNESTTYTYKNPFDGYCYADVVRSIAELHGKIAQFDNNGVLIFKYYSNATDNDHGYNNVHVVTMDEYYDDLSTNEDSVTINHLSASNGPDEFDVGSGSGLVYMNNEFVTEAIANGILSKIQNLTYTPSEFSFLGNPCVEPCDIIYVQKSADEYVKVPVMLHEMYYDGGLKSTIQSFGVSNDEISSSSYSGNSGASGSSYSDSASFKNVNAINAKLTNAIIENLSAKKLIVDSTDAERIVTKALEAESAKIKDLITESINGIPIKNSHILAKALSDEAIQTALGITVTYSTADNPPDNPGEGDLWYKTIVLEGEESEILQEYQDGDWVDVDLDANVFRANFITSQEIATGTITSNEIAAGAITIGNMAQDTVDSIQESAISDVKNGLSTTDYTTINGGLITTGKIQGSGNQGEFSIDFDSGKVTMKDGDFSGTIAAKRGSFGILKIDSGDGTSVNPPQIYCEESDSDGNHKMSLRQKRISLLNEISESAWIGAYLFQGLLALNNVDFNKSAEPFIDVNISADPNHCNGNIIHITKTNGNSSFYLYYNGHLNTNANITTTGGIQCQRLQTGSSDSTVEKHIITQSSSGNIYFFAQGSSTGNRGIYTTSSTGIAHSVVGITNDGLTAYSAGRDLQLRSNVQSGQSVSTFIVLTREQSDAKRTIFKPISTGGAYLGTTNYRWNTAFFTNSITASDLKEKDVIDSFDWKIDEFIKGLKPIAFRRNGQEDGGTRIHLGFGAQDVSKLCNDLEIGDMSLYNAVIVNEDGEEHPYHGEDIDDNNLVWGLNYTEFIAPLVLETQKLMNKVEEQQKQIDELTRKLESLERKLGD